MGKRVEWTEYASLNSIPEEYWGEDLSKLDKKYQGEIIGTNLSFLGETYLVIACDDNKIRVASASKVKIIE